MKNNNVVAGFWTKLFIKLIDFFLVASISIASSFLILEKQGEWKFKYNWLFYLWCIEVITLFLLFFIVLPIISKGKTIGNFITKTTIVSKNNKLVLGVLKREVFFSLSWILIIFLVMIIVNHTLIIKSARINTSSIQFSRLDNLRIGIVSSFGSILIFIQMIIGISALVRKDNKSLSDIYSDTQIIKTNKFIVKPIDVKKTSKIKPQFVKNNIVEWI